MTHLYLIRHGQTDWNVEGRYQGQSDVPLNPLGLEQARKMAEALKDAGITAIYSSDLGRAHQTALALGECTGAPVVVDPRLREVNQGEWEGRLVTEIQELYREVWARRRANPLDVPPPGGETVAQVRERVLDAVNEILKRHPDDRVAIVSHGLALAVILGQHRQLPIEQIWNLIPANAQWQAIEWVVGKLGSWGS